MEQVTLTQDEQTRLQILNSLLADYMTIDQAATLMGVSTRHTRRLLAAYRKEGAAALAHGNRGRRPSNITSETTRSRVIHLARTRYSGANHTHLSELLREHEGIDIGRTTLRRILVNAGLRVSEALALEVRDLSLDSGLPTIHVRRDKGSKPRIVPVHPELHSALASSLQFGNIAQGDRLIKASRSTADKWIRAAKSKAEEAGAIPAGRRISSHTLRHSYARHLLMNGIPIDYLSRWLGHSSIQTTLIYLELVPDPTGSLAAVP